MNKYVSGAIAAEIKITGEKIYLPDIIDLKDKRIKHIDICDELGKSISGNIISDCDGYLSIFEYNTKSLKINDLSFNMLKTSKNQGNRLFINKIIDFPNSYITIPNYQAFLNESLYLVFWFDEPRIMNRVSESGRTAIDSFEVAITGLTNRYYLFGENRTLYQKMFQNLLLYVSENGETANGNVAITETISQNCFVTLQKDNYRYFRGVPAYLFNQTKTRFPLRLQNIQFDFTNSFLEFSDMTGITKGMSVMFNAVFDDNKEGGEL